MKEKSNGRPPKNLHEKRKYQVNIKLITSEYYLLKSLAIEASLPINDYIRACIKSSQVIQRLTPENNNHIRKLTGMANNLNQIAKKANQAGYADVRTEYLFLADNIDNIIEMIKDDSKNSNRK